MSFYSSYRTRQRVVARRDVSTVQSEAVSPLGQNARAPRVWTLGLIGMLVVTFSMVTQRLQISDLGGAIAILGLFVQRDRIRCPGIIWLYLAFVAWAFIGTFASMFPEYARDHVTERLKLTLIMLLAVNSLRTDRQLQIYVSFVVAIFMLFPLRSAFVNYVIGSRLFGRAVGPLIYANPNDLAGVAMLVLSMSLFLGAAYSSDRRIRIASAVSSALLVLLIVLTQSRGALIGMTVGFGPAVIMLVSKRASRLVYAAIAVAVIVALAPTSVWERYAGLQKLTNASTMGQADPEGSADERIRIQKIAWTIAQDHAFLGVGLGAYGRAHAIYAPQMGPKDTHDTYLNLAAETGFPGLILWLVTIASLFRHASKARKRQVDAGGREPSAWLRRGLVAFLVAAIFGSYSGLNIFYLFLSTVWAESSFGRVQKAAPVSPVVKVA